MDSAVRIVGVLLAVGGAGYVVPGALGRYGGNTRTVLSRAYAQLRTLVGRPQAKPPVDATVNFEGRTAVSLAGAVSGHVVRGADADATTAEQIERLRSALNDLDARMHRELGDVRAALAQHKQESARRDDEQTSRMTELASQVDSTASVSLGVNTEAFPLIALGAFLAGWPYVAGWLGVVWLCLAGVALVRFAAHLWITRSRRSGS